mgnify:FL=1
MKRVIMIFLMVALVASVTQMNAQTWKLDPAHSSILFSAKHNGISFVHGRFDAFEGSVKGGSKEDFSGAAITFTAQVESINTNVAPRDNHLRSADFFDVENHPTLTFESTSFKKMSGDTYEVVGNLTMRGTTKEVMFTATHIGSIKGRNGNDVVGFQLKGEVDRNEFGVTGASGSVAPTIAIECNIEMAAQ